MCILSSLAKTKFSMSKTGTVRIINYVPVEFHASG